MYLLPMKCVFPRLSLNNNIVTLNFYSWTINYNYNCFTIQTQINENTLLQWVILLSNVYKYTVLTHEIFLSDCLELLKHDRFIATSFESTVGWFFLTSWKTFSHPSWNQSPLIFNDSIGVLSLELFYNSVGVHHLYRSKDFVWICFHNFTIDDCFIQNHVESVDIVH